MFAVVPGNGTFGQGNTVKAASVHKTLARAMASAKKRTTALRAAMERHGGTSAAYRVIKLREGERAEWLGLDLQSRPSV